MVKQQENRIETLLTQIRDVLRGAPRRSSVQAVEQVIIRRVRVVTAGTLVQGPDIALPTGFTVSIRQRRHSTARTGYVGFSRNAVTNTETRTELENNDSIGVRIDNLKEAWFDATANNTDFEMMAVR